MKFSVLVVFAMLLIMVYVPSAYAYDSQVAAVVGSGLPMYDSESDLTGSGGGQQTLSTIIGTVTGLVMSVVPILFSLVMIFFFFNFYQLIMNTGDAEKHKQARPRIMWSIIIMFVIFSVWGIISLFKATLFDSGGSSYQVTPTDFGSGAPNVIRMQGNMESDFPTTVTPNGGGTLNNPDDVLPAPETNDQIEIPPRQNNPDLPQGNPGFMTI